MKKIVLIEDNPNVLQSTKDILELADYEVTAAGGGKQGVELVKSVLPDLVICDIMMPELDGYGVLRILSRIPETLNIPFIFLTAKTEKNELRKGMNLGADDYITKPFDEAELLEAVEARIKRMEFLKSITSGSELAGFKTSKDISEISVIKDLLVGRKIKVYNAKEIIFREDDYANYLFHIVQGKVKCIKTDFWGKELVNNIYSTGAFMGYLSLLVDGDYGESAIAMERTKVSVIPKSEFLPLIQGNREVNDHFIKMLYNSIKGQKERLLQLAYTPVRERLVTALLMLKNIEIAERQNDGMKLNISREDLASIVGTAKESLIRSLSELKKEGLVDTTGKEIIILDEEGLMKVVKGI